MKTRETLLINKKGHLEIGGCDTVELAKEFKTPLYVMDRAYIEKICNEYNNVLGQKYPNSLVCYASKAFSCTAIYQIVSSLNCGADVVSGGELFTALRGGMDADKLYFHGNNKQHYELSEAVSAGVHAVVIDSFYEIDFLSSIAKANGKKQGVLVRVNPGIDAHTHHFIQTTRVDSKFGFSIADGTAIKAIEKILNTEGLEFLGVHCHIGSQIFELEPFEMAVDKMTDFIVEIKNTLKVDTKELNLGGGYGITYTSEDKPLEPFEYVETIATKLNECVKDKNILAPKLILEPGRSIVGEAGITLYTVGAVKEIIDVKKYVAVDGGMFENPRYTLYEAKYEAVLASKMNEELSEKVTVAGKCCESGDMLVVDTMLPKALSGDILAVLSTGAYNYSMSSNYNRNMVPPVVLVENGKAEYIVRPQTYDDLISRDITIEK